MSISVGDRVKYIGRNEDVGPSDVIGEVTDYLGPKVAYPYGVDFPGEGGLIFEESELEKVE